MLIKEPVVVVCDEVLIFETVKIAVGYLEAPYMDDCTAAYDSEGRLLRLIVTTERRERAEDPQAKPVTVRRRLFSAAASESPDMLILKIEIAEDSPSHQANLKALLVNWLRSNSEHRSRPYSEAWFSQATLREVIDMAMQYKTR